MNLEQELPHLFNELADDHAVGSPPRLDGGDALTVMPSPPQRSRVLVGLAAVAAVAALVGGLVVLSGRDPGPAISDQTLTSTSTPPMSSPPATSPLSNPSGVTLLAPAANSDVRLIALQDWDRSGVATGAVVSPTGTVFSFAVGTGPSWLPDHPEWDAIPTDERGLDTIAGRDVAAVVDASAPTQIYRTVRDDCWSINITSAGEPLWSDDVATLIDAIATNRNPVPATEAAVTVDVPDGWTSLGGGRMLHSWTMTLEVDSDGGTHQVNLAQVPNAPIGVLLSGESNPVAFEHNGQQWWSVDIVTTPGMTTVVGNTGLGAFHITSDLSAEQLVEIVDTLTPTPTDQLAIVPQAPTDTAVPDVTVDEMVDGVPTDTAATNAGTSATTESCGTLGTGLDLVD